jgi:hypothetical protein
MLDEIIAREGGALVYDLHSYNHRRGGPDAPPAPQELNPDVNVGTGALNRDRWGAVVEGFIRSMSQRCVRGRRLDVRENVCFRGGYLSQWVAEAFQDRACVLAIEVKKIFMDEWTHVLDEVAHREVEQALAGSIPGVLGAFHATPC